MLLDKTHRSWFCISATIFVAGAVSYYFYSTNSPTGATGGSVMGLLYGIIGALMMLFAALLAGRKPLRVLRLGSAQFWLRGHLWLGTLSFPYILFHAGFSWGGLLEVLLWITFGIVVVSGFFGLAMQHILPRLLSSAVPHETVSSPTYYRERLAFLGDVSISQSCGALDVGEHTFKDLYIRLINFYETADKEGKRDWLKQIDPESRDLFRNVAEHVKADKSIKSLTNTDKFPELIAKMYAGLPSISSGPGSTKKKGGPSPLDQIKKGNPAAAKQDPDEKKKLSPLELARQQSKAKTGSDDDGKKKSPLELAREQTGVAGQQTASKEIPSKPKTAKHPIPRKASVDRKTSKNDPLVGSKELMKLYVDTVRPFLCDPVASSSRKRFLDDGNRLLAGMRMLLPEGSHVLVDLLSELCEERIQFELQRKIHRWIHGWLIIHIPVSIVLIVLFIAHVITALRVVPPGN